MEFRSTLRPFGIPSYDSDKAKTHKIAAQLDAQRVATKKALLLSKNCVSEQKPSKIWVFWAIQVYTKTVRNFIV